MDKIRADRSALPVSTNVTRHQRSVLLKIIQFFYV